LGSQDKTGSGPTARVKDCFGEQAHWLHQRSVPASERHASKERSLNSKSIERSNMPKLAEYRETKATRAHIAPKSVEVAFSLDAPGAQEVYLCGDFNEWSPTSLRMIRYGARDHWEKRLILAPGRYQYKFVVDDVWVHDTGASENARNHHGSLNSVIEVRE
jgi:1,4-alpha-glucan branching enzyme